ncbi:GDSL-type esterase/lipase family protein [Gryllotalpicola ginsengisoli]|uniref:GDSL-type esterase/lipase family protein n=1 Tax=Gryllotalpicola ginsengisoli TaxID=444608 RepID=UPI0003B708D2|nr:GDSL-type esterase/lipase family protein [Gryllotalpicola ginsengisoli]
MGEMRDDGAPRVTAFVGDSLTAGGDWQAWLPDESVINFGVGGNTTDDLLERLDDVIAAQPQTVVLLIGTNDFAWRQPVEHIVRNTETILFKLRKALPDAQLLVIGILPRQPEYAHVIREVNTHVRQYASTVRAQYLDAWPVLASDDGGLKHEYTEDELHLTPAGYQALLSELKPALETLRGQPPSSRAIILPRSTR